MRKLLLILLIGFFASAKGVTYYVQDSGGNDAYTTTQAQNINTPWKTIQKGADVATAGDTVIVKDGTYTRDAYPYLLLLYYGNGGSEGNYITFRSENKHGAVLDGENAIDNGIGIGNGKTYIKIIDFEIKNFLKEGLICSDGTGSNIIVQGCHIHHIGRICTTDAYGKNGLYFAHCSYITFDKNLFNDIGRLSPAEGCAEAQYYQEHDHGLYLDGVSYITITYNIFYNCNRGWAIHLYDESSSNINIYNNTFVDGNPYKPEGCFILLGCDLATVNIKNNIFSQPGDYAITTYAGTYSSITVANNLSYGGTGGMVDVVKSGMTVSGNLTNTDPLFTNYAGHDYSLQEGSPAINAGTDVGLSTDYAGNEIMGVPDIGAYEYTAAIFRYKWYGKWVKYNGKFLF